MKGTVRLVAWCLAIALVALPIVGVLRGWFAAGRWPVTQLTVQAEFQHVTADQLREIVMPRLGKGFFALDLDGVQKAVAALPWVESVEARKRWPDTLILRIYERQPFARWNEKRLISRQGLVFDVPDVPANASLPDLRAADEARRSAAGRTGPHHGDELWRSRRGLRLRLRALRTGRVPVAVLTEADFRPRGCEQRGMVGCRRQARDKAFGTAHCASMSHNASAGRVFPWRDGRPRGALYGRLRRPRPGSAPSAGSAKGL